MRIQITGPGSGGRGPNGPRGILARILITIVAVVMLAAAAFLGAIFFLAALGVFFAVSLILGVRIWWAKRQIEKAIKSGASPGMAGPRSSGARQPGSETVIEGEYVVVDERNEPGHGDGK